MTPSKVLAAIFCFTTAASACNDTLAQTESPIKDCAELLASSPCGTNVMGTEVDVVCQQTCGLCPCEDTLAQTPSPIKDCAVLIASSPCGTSVMGTEVSAVCQKSCGLCGDGMLNTDPVTPSPDRSSYTVQLSPPFQSGEYTDFSFDGDWIFITSVVPVTTDWFGYIFYTYTATVGDPTTSLAYYFKIHSDNRITYRSLWLTYFGPTGTLSHLNITAPVWECTKEAEIASNGNICKFDDAKQEGDFMVGTGGWTLGMRPQPADLEDVEILSNTSDGSSLTIVWRRSRTAPFDGSTVQLRYASAPAALVTPTIDTVLGFKYHGYETRYSSSINLEGADQQEGLIVDGMVQHKWVSGTTVIIGSDYGWNNPPPGASRYADIQNATVGTILSFTYLGVRNVALFASASALENCDISAAVVAAGNWDSPFELHLNQTHVGQIFIGPSNTGTGPNGVEPLQCMRGSKFTVTVSDTDATVSDTDATVSDANADGAQRSALRVFPAAPAMSIFAAATAMQ